MDDSSKHEWVFAPCMSRFNASESTEASRKARELRNAGHHVVDLSIGEPDFPVPHNVKAAVADALARDDTHYTNVAGTPQLLDAVRSKYLRENGLEYARNEVVVGTGAKQLMFAAMLCTICEDDEVIVPRPYWISYPNQVRIAGGSPVFVDCALANGFRLAADDLERKITPRTRWLILNSPNNPTGAVLSRSDLRAIADVLLAYPHVLVMSDEIYEHLVYGDATHISIVAIEPRLRKRALVVNGTSKAYAMTGLRIGYAAGPAELLCEIAKLQSQSTSCASSLGQAAAVEALNGPQDVVDERRHIMEQRRNRIVDRLRRIEGLRVTSGDGAMYAFVDCRGLIGKSSREGKSLESAQDFAQLLLDEFKVVVVPGKAYGASGYIRLSFATAMENIDEGCNRIERACQSLDARLHP